MMQRCCVKFRSIVLQSAHTLPSLSSSTSRRLIHASPQPYQPLRFASSRRSFRPLFNASSTTHSSLAFQPFPSSFPLSVCWVCVLCRFFLSRFSSLSVWLLRKCLRKKTVNFEYRNETENVFHSPGLVAFTNSF